MENDVVIIAKTLIKEFEGLSLKTYCCSAGIKTIGYGHVVRDRENLTDTITNQQAEELLDEDIMAARRSLYRQCNVPLNPHQEAALISFIFNLGSGAFQPSTLRQKLNRGEYGLAADELLKWVYAAGIKLKGLARRRELERTLFLSEICPKELVSETVITNTAPVFAIVTATRSFSRKLMAYIV